MRLIERQIIKIEKDIEIGTEKRKAINIYTHNIVIIINPIRKFNLHRAEKDQEADQEEAHRIKINY